MKTSPLGIGVIKQFEGLRLEAYRDGGGKWTIGWGHTLSARAGMKITIGKAETLFADDLSRTETQVSICLAGVVLNQNQWDALASFTFNLGGHRLQTSTLLKLIKQGDFAGAAAEFPKWCHVDGKEELGLFKRREAEQMIFTS